MKIHRIKSEHGASFDSRCGQEIFDPDREFGTTDPHKVNCAHCGKPDKVKTLRPRGFCNKHICPQCGRSMSKASMVRHNYWTHNER